MAFTAKKYIAIDWDKKDLRMATVRSRGDHIDLLKAVSVPLPADLALDNPELLGAFIREAMRQSSLGTRHALMSIPRDQVVLNTLNLPPTPADDMPALVQFQVVKELPFAADQATIDFAVPRGHDPKTPSPTLVAAVRVEVIEFYRQVAREAGLTLERIDLRPYANLRAVLASVPELASQTVFVIDVGPYLTEINIVESGLLAFSSARIVPLPRLDQGARERIMDSRISMIPPLDAEEDEETRDAVNRLMVDVIRSYEAHRATSPQTNVDHIVVCGASGVEAELVQSLAARFGAPAQLFTPEKALDLTPQRARELRGFSAVLGVALGHGRVEMESFDFLAPKKPVSKRARRLRKAPVAIGAAVLVLGAGLWGHVYKVRPAWAEVESTRAKLESLQKIEKPYQEFIKQVKALEDWRTSEQYWPEVIAEMTRVFPSDQQVSVDRMELDLKSAGRSNKRDGHLTLRLRVAESGMVNMLSDALRSLGYSSVQVGGETPRSSRGPDVYRFDTSLIAALPQREPRNWEDEAGDSEGKPDALANDAESEAVDAPVTTTRPAAPSPAGAGGSR